MVSDESTDLADSEAVNAYGRLLLKRNTKILASIPRKVKMSIHYVIINTSIFFIIETCHPC